jgi:hypothetical protein
MKVPKKQTRARRSERPRLPQATEETTDFGRRLPQRPFTKAPAPGMSGMSQKYSLKTDSLDSGIWCPRRDA